MCVTHVCVCVPFTTAGCPLSEAGPGEPHAGVLTVLPSRQGPSPCFLSPGLPGLLALSPGAPGWVVGRDGGPAGLSRLPPDAAFPCGDLRGCLRIYFHFVIISYKMLIFFFFIFSLFLFFLFLVFFTGVAAGPPTFTHPLSTLLFSWLPWP